MSKTTEQNKRLVREGIEATNERDAERLRELVADDVVVHGQDIQSADDLVSANTNNTAFPDSHLEIEEMIAEGDTVAVRMTFTGTHEGNMLGIEATGKEIEIRVMSMYRIENEQLAEAWVVEDDTDTLQQLGLWQELTG